MMVDLSETQELIVKSTREYVERSIKSSTAPSASRSKR
jgi:hypothetical protein